MIVYKSFLRKKTTKIYLFILTMLLTAFFIIYNERRISIHKVNTISPEMIEVSTTDKELINKIDHKNIKEIITSSIVYKDYMSFALIEDKNLSDERIELSEYFDEYVISILNEKLEDFNTYEREKDESISYHNIIYLSKNNFAKMTQGNDKYTYFLRLKKWYERENIKEYLTNDLNVDELEETGSGSTAKYNYETYAHIFTVILIIIGVIFIITLFITIKNLLMDEEKNNTLLSYLGFKKNKIMLYNFLKIALLLIVASIISTILTILFNVL